jgi:hypothetical protein
VLVGFPSVGRLSSLGTLTPYAARGAGAAGEVDQSNLARNRWIRR